MNMDLVPVQKVNFVPCVRWVKKGVAKVNPDKVQVTEKEWGEMFTKAKTELEDDSEEDKETEDCDLDEKGDDEYDFKHYDEEEVTAGSLALGGTGACSFSGKDPYITVDDDSEKEDDEIHPGDNLILVGHVEGDACILEVFVYNEEEDSFYVHHDMLLSTYPLCIEWLNYEPQSKGALGNLCAIGTMSPVIEIWDLDILNCIEPSFKLGRKKNKKKGIKAVGHKDAVLDLAWNTSFTHILASGSVDQTVLLWDLDSGLPATKLTSFNEKVQTIKWHPFESQTLLTGCCDSLLRVFDCRIEDSHKKWAVEGEVERVLWNHFDPFYFFASTNEGKVYYFDCRSNQAVWTVGAHSKEVTGLSLSSKCPGFLVTASTDGTIKIWDIMKGLTGNHCPALVFEKQSGIGDIHCLDGSPDSPFVFCAGGNDKSNCFKKWDFSTNPSVIHNFSSRELLETLTVKSDLNVEPSNQEFSSHQKLKTIRMPLGESSKVNSEPMDTSGEPIEAMENLSLQHGKGVKKLKKNTFPIVNKKKKSQSTKKIKI